MMNFNIFSNSFEDIFKNNSSEKDNNQSDSYLTQNRALWKAVILQSIIDIINSACRTENKIAKIEAKQWVFTDNEDFKQVCHLAGYTVPYVRKKIMEIMRQNMISKIIINKSHKEDKFMSFIRDNPTFENILNDFLYEKKIRNFHYT